MKHKLFLIRQFGIEYNKAYDEIIDIVNQNYDHFTE